MSLKFKVQSLKFKTIYYCLLPIAYCLLVVSCGSDKDDIATPRPFAYFRIDLPEKKYSVFHDDCPFEFEYPSDYARVLPDNKKNADPCWKNIIYPRFGAEINLSYKSINNNLSTYLDDSWSLATCHQVKASGMFETSIIRDSANVYGLMFEIEGNAASSLQFYVTDSTQHFLRGALYFYAHPNYDSLAPVIAFLKKDVERMITTLKWLPPPALPRERKIKAPSEVGRD
ncbi:MAG: gliding motility lipoprotein GldD [Bacteroidetes bacterium]|nr:gliding motility lipoprotein GldD [Bacteroidota bacterium]